MTKEIRIKLDWITKLEMTGNLLLCHGLMQASEMPLTVTEVSKLLSITYPTAQKCLQQLAEKELVKEIRGKYVKVA